MEKASDKEFDGHTLIEAQRRLMSSKHPFEQVVCTLWVAGTLISAHIALYRFARNSFHGVAGRVSVAECP
jgi:hypothetical protein